MNFTLLKLKALVRSINQLIKHMILKIVQIKNIKMFFSVSVSSNLRIQLDRTTMIGDK